ncbi:MAG: hypothetical protein MJA29_14055 [Candidatus Omnitrophica bacterium]|nr:hypothetical protein [Candidatus Omnitrophota bacterium]
MNLMTAPSNFFSQDQELLLGMEQQFVITIIKCLFADMSNFSAPVVTL